MSKKVKLTILFVLTFFVGGLVGFVSYGFLFAAPTFATFYGDGLTEIAIDAYQLERGQTAHVLERKASALPQLTLSYYQTFYKHCSEETRNQPLWQVQKYYQIAEQQIPAAIKPILETLPPRPLTSCERKRINDANAKNLFCRPPAKMNF